MRPNRFSISALAAFSVAFGPQALAAQTVDRPAEATIAPFVRQADPQAAQRYAIVVGNDRYQHVAPLFNARADAALVAEFLRSSGFFVVERYDLDARGFEALLRKALFEIEADAEVLFYYAGHGFQIGRRNYVVPVDADLKSSADVAFETVTLDSLVAILGARARLQVVFLDSCRDNPFADQTTLAGLSSIPQPTKTGYAPMSAPMNTLLSFSTAPGAVAIDGAGANSPFTGALIDVASSAPGRSLTRVLEQVRRQVYRETEGRQIPWESSTLVEDFSFANAVAEDATPTPRPAKATPMRRLTEVPARVTRQAADPAAPIALEAGLDRRVAIGAALRAALGDRPPGGLVLAQTEGEGRLILAPDQRAERSYLGNALDVATLDMLVYEPEHRQQPAGPRPADHRRTARFTLTGPEGYRRDVALTLEADACDWHAGDHLDPEGVGIVRYANEIAPEEARAACQASIAASPDTARFYYQLSRALVALTAYEAAETALQAAQARNYTRAWYGLGQLAGARRAITGGRDDRAADEAAYPFYYEGVRRGDPYAFYALGKQLLRFSGNDEMQSIGFDLMNRALEVGHTFAMNELGYFFLQEGSAHYAPRRALQYLRESAAREDIYGYFNLGRVYDRGLGETAPDAALAENWYRRAVLGGHPSAPRRLADMIVQGRLGVPAAADIAEALALYDLGLERGDALAGTQAAWLIATAHPADSTLGDAAWRAAKAGTLRNAAARADARDLLVQMPAAALDDAIRLSLVALKALPEGSAPAPQSVAVLTALTALAAQAGKPLPDAAVDRLLVLAALFWERSRFRVDLY
ncbi:MAG: caspase family protein [Pseudomonadota bacterium]